LVTDANARCKGLVMAIPKASDKGLFLRLEALALKSEAPEVALSPAIKLVLLVGDGEARRGDRPLEEVDQGAMADGGMGLAALWGLHIVNFLKGVTAA